MTNLEYLTNITRDRLGGDRSRMAELFEDGSIFAALRANARDSDWYHFQQKTYDGCYLIQGTDGYEVYQQERGSKSGHRFFAKLSDAARHYFSLYW